MFRIKICGLTHPDDARAVAAAGADAIGLNFYPASKRYVSPAVAEEIIRELPESIVRVGLFVNAPVAEIRLFVDRLGLNMVQLHGDESPADLAALGEIPVMKAVRPTTYTEVNTYLDDCLLSGCQPRLVLLDAKVPGAFGGTGARANWEVARQYVHSMRMPPLVLAGGLTPDNVAEAIRAVRPAAVDTASGVESAPGRKDSGTDRAVRGRRSCGICRIRRTSLEPSSWVRLACLIRGSPLIMLSARKRGARDA